jgi:hypothetical protein
MRQARRARQGGTRPGSLGGGDGDGDGEGLAPGLGLGAGLGLGPGATGQPGAQTALAGQSQTLAAALKIRPAGQGVTVAAPLAHFRKVAQAVSKGLA